MEKIDYIRMLLLAGTFLVFWAAANTAPVINAGARWCSLNAATCVGVSAYPAFLTNPLVMVLLTFGLPAVLTWLAHALYLRRFYEPGEWPQK